jgi:hypothetical protein
LDDTAADESPAKNKRNNQANKNNSSTDHIAKTSMAFTVYRVLAISNRSQLK